MKMLSVVVWLALQQTGFGLLPRAQSRRSLSALRAEAEPLKRKKTRGSQEAPPPAKKKKKKSRGSATAEAATVVVAAPAAPVDTTPLELGFDFANGGAYAVLSTTQGRTLRLLVDSGASITSVTSEAALSTIVEPLRLKAAIAPSAAFPQGVDGILGFDMLNRYKAVEFDWAQRTLRLHTASYPEKTDSLRLPMRAEPVGLGMLPLVTLSCGDGAGKSCEVKGVVDTGSPVTIVTPELAKEAGLSKVEGDSKDVTAVGVDGEPTTLIATLAPITQLGETGQGTRVVKGGTVYAGTVPMMGAVGWAGLPMALIGLDFLASDGAGELRGKLILDFEAEQLAIETVSDSAPETVEMVAIALGDGPAIVGETASMRPTEGTFVSMRCSTRDGDLMLLVDTAATGLVLSPSAASRLKLTLQEVQGSVTSAGGTGFAPPTVTSIADLVLGGSSIKLPRVSAIVQDVGVLPQPLDGILGLDVLERFAAVDFDYRNRKFVFHAMPPAEPKTVLTTAPLRRTAIGVLATEFAIDTTESCELIVDTGAPSSLLDETRGANLLKDDEKLEAVEGVAAMGADGRVLELTKRLRTKYVALGGSGVNLLDEDLQLDIGTLPVLSVLTAAEDARVAGVLGADVLLRSSTLRLDFRNSKLLIFDE